VSQYRSVLARASWTRIACKELPLGKKGDLVDDRFSASKGFLGIEKGGGEHFDNRVVPTANLCEVSCLSRLMVVTGYRFKIQTSRTPALRDGTSASS